MTFKEARKQARELAKENGYWSYIYRTKNKKEKTYEVSNEQNFNISSKKSPSSIFYEKNFL